MSTDYLLLPFRQRDGMLRAHVIIDRAVPRSSSTAGRSADSSMTSRAPLTLPAPNRSEHMPFSNEARHA
jgi:hypothetical protein